MPSPSFKSILLFLIHFFFLLLLSLFLTQAEAKAHSHAQSSSAACKTSPYPKLCRSILRTIRSSPSDPFGYSKFSVKQCLKQTKKLAKVFKDYNKKLRNSTEMTQQEHAALEDCGELNQLNVENLESVSYELKNVEYFSEELVEKVQTYLSAIATNHQTCFDGLAASKSKFASVLEVPLKGVTKMYSVSLGLIRESLIRNSKKLKKRGGSNGANYKPKDHLETLIKNLRKIYHCKAPKECSRVERVLEEHKGRGILVSNIVIVSPNGSDNFTSIGEAIEHAPDYSRPRDGYFLIYAREGLYEEYILVPKRKSNILLIGDGINNTIITGNHNFVDGWTTFNSPTFAVSGDRFMAVDITFRNTAGPHKHQAVAVRNNADLSSFYRCSFEGYQDTLYVHSFRQFYKECDIYGTIDFIFGNAAAVFQNCRIYVRKPLPNQKTAVTAQGRTDPNQNTGISIQNCTIEAAPDFSENKNSTLNYLGRPWKHYSRTVYLQSYIGDLIYPSGWLEWNGTVGLDTLYYGEFKNYGPGANTDKRVKWPGYNLMTITQAWNFTVYNFTLGDTWLPDTDIPFSLGIEEED